MSDYNGWTNYETWAAKLWIDNDQGSQEYWLERAQATKNEAPRNVFSTSRDQERRLCLAKQLKDYHDEAAEEWMGDQSSLFADLIKSALGAVNWHEIANSLMEDADEIEEAS